MLVYGSITVMMVILDYTKLSLIAFRFKNSQTKSKVFTFRMNILRLLYFLVETMGSHEWLSFYDRERKKLHFRVLLRIRLEFYIEYRS